MFRLNTIDIYPELTTAYSTNAFDQLARRMGFTEAGASDLIEAYGKNRKRLDLEMAKLKSQHTSAP